MERPSEQVLINYFRGKAEAHQVEIVKLYLAMNTDEEYVTSCLKEALLMEQDSSPIVLTEDDVLRFQQRFSSHRYTLEHRSAKRSGKTLIVKFFRNTWIRAAAVLLLSAITLYGSMLMNKEEKETLAGRTNELNRNEALLTLADGSVLSLSEAKVGELALQDGLIVEKTADGNLIYKADAGSSGTHKIVYNTISTPAGGQYQVLLPDGSVALLNASSSLTYPIHFPAHERRVKMKGEIYFEITKSKQGKTSIPFFVQTDQQEVQVLGTHFNVNAYADEPFTRTTLVEGSVLVTKVNDGKSVLLKPGQEAQLSDELRVVTSNVEQQLGWKNGDFVFQQEDLASVLRKVSRWYDVEISCPPDLANVQLSGMISRSHSLDAVISSLSALGTIKITKQGGRLFVER